MFLEPRAISEMLWKGRALNEASAKAHDASGKMSDDFMDAINSRRKDVDR